MTSTDFLKRLCEGYVRSYRTFNLREIPRNFDRRNPIHPRWVDETHRELSFFAHLGEALGYVSRFEMGTGRNRRRWDVSWVDPDHKVKEKQVVLCMECENDHHKANGAIRKLLGPEGSKACYLVGLLGWVPEDHFRRIKQRVEQAFVKHPKNSSILLMACVGADEFQAVVAAYRKLSTREGKWYLDKDKYWYARFVGEWENANGDLRDRQIP